MASSIVKALGRPEWSAKTEEEYVSIVCTLAKDVEGRKEWRKSQHAAMMRSPLCDAKSLARSLEDAIESMYDQWMAAG
jgi:predicted O-linked N-acetylglucosamine transferase (SPINDLY family)